MKIGSHEPLNYQPIHPPIDTTHPLGAHDVRASTGTEGESLRLGRVFSKHPAIIDKFENLLLAIFG